MSTVLIAANPRSGSRSRVELVERLAHHIQAAGFLCEVVADLDLLAERAHELQENRQLRATIAAGGDGTVNAVVSRIPVGASIGVLPLGSENLLAKHYGFSLDPEACCRRLVANRTEILDAMDIDGRLALLMASIGFDASVVRRVHQNRRTHITRWAYRYQAFRTWFTYRWPPMEVEVLAPKPKSAVNSVYRTQWCFLFNFPRYATGLQIVPEADPNDGLLDVGLFEKSSALRGLFQYWDVLRGRHRTRSDWKQFRAESIRITSNALVQPDVQIDGDWVCSTPLLVKVLSKRFRLLV